MATAIIVINPQFHRHPPLSAPQRNSTSASFSSTVTDGNWKRLVLGRSCLQKRATRTYVRPRGFCGKLSETAGSILGRACASQWRSQRKEVRHCLEFDFADSSPPPSAYTGVRSDILVSTARSPQRWASLLRSISYTLGKSKRVDGVDSPRED